MEPQGSLHVRPANDPDIAEIASLLTEGAERQRTLDGTTGWPIPYPLEEVALSVHQHAFYVVEIDGEIIATFMLVWDDVRLWGSQPPIAGYLHKLVVRRRWAHRDIGRRTIEWVADRVRASGRSVLRLDCRSTNRRLVAYYESLGFQGIRVVRAGPPGKEQPCLLMERPLV
ncbi:MAG TPA: GNAT family N-acetyltransferase [Thermoplasmata archaeon]|nr:GNAT family N-acetyltransferase [Thermoplasmata archaeon]